MFTLKNKKLILGGNLNLLLDPVIEVEDVPTLKYVSRFIEIYKKFNLSNIWGI